MESWYTVKGLFRWYLKASGTTDRIEERIVLFRARSFDHALDMAEREAKKYCAPDRKANFRIEPVGWWYAYALNQRPSSGAEVFSRRSITSLSSESFVRRYYPESHRANAG